MSVSERLLLLLKEEGINQSIFSKKTGYPRTNLNNFITGITKTPKIDLIIAIHTYFPHWNTRYLLVNQGEKFDVGRNGTLNSLDSNNKDELELKVILLEDQLRNCKEHLKDKEKIISLLSKK